MAKSKKDVGATTQSKDLSFQTANQQLQGSFNCALLSNEDAAFMVVLMDDLLHECMALVDAQCDYIKAAYSSITFHAIRKDTLKTFTTYADKNTLRFVSRFVAGPQPELNQGQAWLKEIQKHVRIYRSYWVEIVDRCLEAAVLQYRTGKPAQPSAENPYVPVYHEDMLYGTLNALRLRYRRIKDIEDRLSRPFVRRVATVARNFARDPDLFRVHYQQGYCGVLIAAGRYDPEFGSFASQVNMWVSNQVIGSIKTENTMFKVPDRVYKHRELVEAYRRKNPAVTLEEIAEKENIDLKTLEHSLSLQNMQNVSQILDDLDDDEPASYMDMSHENTKQIESVTEQLDKYSADLTDAERVVLALLFDYDSVAHNRRSEAEDVRREAFRQVYHVVYGQAA